MEAQPSWGCRIFKIVAITTGGGDGHFVQSSEGLAQKVIRGQVVLLVVGARSFNTDVVRTSTSVYPNFVEFVPTSGTAEQGRTENNGLVGAPCTTVHLVANAAGIQFLSPGVLQTNLDVGGVSRDDQVFAGVYNDGSR